MKRPAAIAALGRLAGVCRLTDANLEKLHDLALIALVRCQHEMQRRGISGIHLVQRTEGISLLSTNPGKPSAVPLHPGGTRTQRGRAGCQAEGGVMIARLIALFEAL
jgi:hypothetical protein